MRLLPCVILMLVGCDVPTDATKAATRDAVGRVPDSVDGQAEKKIVVTPPDEMHVTADGRLETAGNIPIKDRLGNVMYASGSGGDSDESGYCMADLVFESPSGDLTNFDGCVQSNMDASFEFDPDTRPEVRTVTMDFSSTREAGYDCSLRVQLSGVCGVGTYYVGRATTALLTTYDCLGVDDGYEGKWRASSGRVLIDRLDVDSVRGASPSSALPVRVAGIIDFRNINGWKVKGPFQLNQVLTGSDAEELACLEGIPAESKSGGCAVAAASPRAMFFPVLLGIVGAALRRRRATNSGEPQRTCAWSKRCKNPDGLAERNA